MVDTFLILTDLSGDGVEDPTSRTSRFSEKAEKVRIPVIELQAPVG